MSEIFRQDRRRFLENAAVTIVAARFGMMGTLSFNKRNTADSVDVTKKSTNTSFETLKQINAGLLNVGYAEEGDVNATAVILLHGWPYDIHSYLDVSPLLTSKGYRVIIPYLRGYGPTRFLSEETIRNGQPSALASDIVDLMDAMQIKKQFLPALTGVHERLQSSLRFGQNVVKRSCQLAVI